MDATDNQPQAPSQAENSNSISEKRRLPEALAKHCWQPGQSGNPGGRPKKKPITEIYEQILQEPDTEELIKAFIRKSIASGRMVGQLQLKEMAERVEGKITQPVEMSGELALAVSDRVGKARERVQSTNSGLVQSTNPQADVVHSTNESDTSTSL